MPSPRRLRLVFLATIITVVLILYYSHKADSRHDPRSIQDFYHKTMDGMKKGSPPGQAVVNSDTGAKAGHIPADKDADGDVDEDDKKASTEMQMRLKAAEQAAKDKANEKAGPKPDPPRNVVGKGSSAEGQMKKGAKVDDKLNSNVDSEPARKETKEEHDAEIELAAILKQSPVVIFSKSYCPHSKRAKGILLEKYTITPAPYVVELDEMALGQKLQDLLLDRTGRRTVPNVLINGVSIGGADDIVALDNDDKLASKIRFQSSKRVQVSERFAAGGAKS